MTPEETVMLIMCINTLIIIGLAAYALWWQLWGKKMHYRRVILWTHLTHWKHYEYDDAVAYFRKHGRSS